jgi:hypothetical protein
LIDFGDADTGGCRLVRPGDSLGHLGGPVSGVGDWQSNVKRGSLVGAEPNGLACFDLAFDVSTCLP